MSDTINKPIYISEKDHENLRLRLASLTEPRSRKITEKLRREVERAVVLPEAGMPEGVVRIGSVVALRDLDTGEVDEYTLTLPEHADPANGRLSVFAPLGTAIIGFSANDEIVWEMPAGPRRLLIERVSSAASSTAA